MARTDVGAAINASLSPIVDYHTDPRGWSLFARLSAWAQRGVAGREGTVVTRRQAEFNGYAAPPQQFTGMAPLGVSTQVTDRQSMLSDERSTGVLDNAALRIFAERLRRGR